MGGLDLGAWGKVVLEEVAGCHCYVAGPETVVAESEEGVRADWSTSTSCLLLRFTASPRPQYGLQTWGVISVHAHIVENIDLINWSNCGYCS